ncbi:MAG: hypothetical protein JO102_04145 [Elusimicrobia bacterium]|nr:hypothetical protein [Elusimicrobiota bacterium]
MNQRLRPRALAAVLALTVAASAAAADMDAKARTLMGLAVGDATFADVQTKLGFTSIADLGDAEDPAFLLCYESGGALVRFVSNGQFGGPPKYPVVGVRVGPTSERPSGVRCAKLPKDAVPRLDNGLALGAKRADVEKLMGKPSTDKGDRWIYSASIDEPMPRTDPQFDYWAPKKDECFDGRDPYFTIGSNVVVKFTSGTVTDFAVVRTKTAC